MSTNLSTATLLQQWRRLEPEATASQPPKGIEGTSARLSDAHISARHALLQRSSRLGLQAFFIFKLLLSELGKPVSRQALSEGFFRLAGYKNTATFPIMLCRFKSFVKQDPDMVFWQDGPNYMLRMRETSLLADIRPANMILAFESVRLGLREVITTTQVITVGATDYAILLHLFKNGEALTPATDLIPLNTGTRAYVGARRCLDVQITRLRRKLACLDIEVATATGLGWFLKQKGDLFSPLGFTARAGRPAMMMRRKTVPTLHITRANKTVPKLQKSPANKQVNKAKEKAMKVEKAVVAEARTCYIVISDQQLRHQIEQLVRAQLKRKSTRFIVMSDIMEKFGDHAKRQVTTAVQKVLSAYHAAGHLLPYRKGSYCVIQQPLVAPVFEMIN